MSNLAFPKTCVRDALGNALVGAKIYFYEVGTTTDKDTYQDHDLVTPNTNPVVTGSDGFTPPVFLSADAYKIAATDADDVAIAGYSCDEYWPSRPESEAKLVGTSADSDPAVSGTNSSDGAGVHGVSSGTGPGVIAEADTSAPASSALRVIPQDNIASSPVKGDIQIWSYGGRPVYYDGTEHVYAPGMLACASGSSAPIGLAYTQLGSFTIPIGVVAGQRKIVVQAWFSCASQAGSPTFKCGIFVDGVLVAVSPSATAVSGHRCFLSVAIHGSGTAMYSFGYGSLPVAQSAETVAGNGSFINEVFTPSPTTTPIAITFEAIRVGGTSANIALTGYNVEVA